MKLKSCGIWLTKPKLRWLERPGRIETAPRSFLVSPMPSLFVPRGRARGTFAERGCSLRPNLAHQTVALVRASVEVHVPSCRLPCTQRVSHGLALRKSDWQKIPMRKARQAVLELAGREVVITNPDKPFFPQAGHTKLHLVRYYAAVAEGALRGIAGRPIVLKRYVDGAAGEPFFQKRAPEQRPEWIETVELRFPSGRTAREIVVRDAAQLLWMVNLGCIDLNPHPVRADDLEHPDELRVDLDPGPGVSWDFVRRVTLLVRDVLDEHGLRGWPKTSGSRGMHVNVRIQRRWSFEQVRRAALALAREVERRAPDLASSKWWKEERRGVFLDYNQNAKDRTVASAWSVRPTPDARVSMPLEWDEVADCDPAAFTLATAPARLAERGDASAGIDSAAGSLDALLELSASQEAAGLADAPWPPHYKK